MILLDVGIDSSLIGVMFIVLKLVEFRVMMIGLLFELDCMVILIVSVGSIVSLLF